MIFHLPKFRHSRRHCKRPVAADPVSEHIVSYLQSPTILENELFLDNMYKEADFSNFFLKNVSDLKK